MTALPVKHTVTFDGWNVFQNGVRIGRFDGGRGLVYVMLWNEEKQYDADFFARFKFGGRTRAKKFAKMVLSRLTPAEYLERRKEGSPMEKSPVDILLDITGMTDEEYTASITPKTRTRSFKF